MDQTNELLSPTINLSLRVPASTAETFKELAREKNCSQGEVLQFLVEQNQSLASNQHNDIQITPTIESPQHIKLLLKDNNQPAKTFSFYGDLVTYLPNSRPFHSFSFQYFNQELGYQCASPNLSTFYQYCIYRIDGKSNIPHDFLVYEYIGVIEYIDGIQRQITNIKRAWFATDLQAILQKLSHYISVPELESIEYQLATPIDLSQIPAF